MRIGRPPSLIRSITILNTSVDAVTGTLALNITWEPPFPYGKLLFYRLVINAVNNSAIIRTVASRVLKVSLILSRLKIVIMQCNLQIIWSLS